VQILETGCNTLVMLPMCITYWRYVTNH